LCAAGAQICAQVPRWTGRPSIVVKISRAMRRWCLPRSGSVRSHMIKRQQVAEDLRRRIEAEEFKVGDRLTTAVLSALTRPQTATHSQHVEPELGVRYT
jgi:exosome complex RNA-binding protein Csl4